MASQLEIETVKGGVMGKGEDRELVLQAGVGEVQPGLLVVLDEKLVVQVLLEKCLWFYLSHF